MNNNTVGGKIKNIRRSKNLSQDDVAKDLDITRSAISKIENGKQAMTIDLLQKFVRTYNVSADFLLGISDESKLTLKDDHQAE